ncbi:capsid scaffolding serine peptidase GPO [Pseudomonas graminis]|nr:capsid scaffolding serine peptidase GPO [Pseudomonas graminis]
MGLGVTDTPASLGTEMLAFSAQHPDASPLKARKQSQDNLFTVMAHAFNSSLAPQIAVCVLCKSDGAQTGLFPVEAGPAKTLRAPIGTGFSLGCVGWHAAKFRVVALALPDSNRSH